MEKLRHKRSKFAAKTDRSSQWEPALPGGNKQVQRQRKLPNLSSDSSSCGGGAADEDSFSIKLGRKSSKSLFGTPMKKLLAEEMSKETESKRKAPSVIARLMGLDGLPLLHPANKLHKGSSEFHLQRTAEVEKTCSGRSSRRSSKDQQEFKDVFEVSEVPKVQSNRISSQIADAEISFIEQKFMDAKRLASDQDLQNSKEFNDALEVLDSNTDLLLKYFQRPDSLFKKHLNDLQADPVQSHCGLVEATKPSDIENYEHDDFSWKSDRDTTRLNYNKSHLEHHDGYPHHFDRRRAVHSSPKVFKLREPDAVPTRIVVLKPNLGRVQNVTKFVSSPCSSNSLLSECGKCTKTQSWEGAECYQTLPDTVKLLRQNSMESREIAKEITRQMKNNLNNSSVIFSSSRCRGYAGDDSSCNFSGNESPEETKVTALNLGDSFNTKSHSRSSSHSSESSLSREAKKRLSERWKVAHKSQQVQAISRGSTLAEMLAIPDKEMKAANFDSSSGGKGLHKIDSNGEPAGWVEPLGISSRDGWKDGCIGSLSRSKSLPASSTAFGIPRTIIHHEAFRDDRFMMPKEAPKLHKKKAAKGLNERLGVNPRSSRSGHRKSRSSHDTDLESGEASPDIDTIRNRVKINFGEVDTPKQEVMISESLAESLRDTGEITKDVVEAANENVVLSSEPPEELLPELSSCVLVKGNTGAVDEDNPTQQELSVESSHESSVSFQPPHPGVESSCCRDADQPSPVSVLEPSFTDDVSSCSECFESLYADLQGLRMQLQLLKLESEEYAEGPMLISSDEDGGEVSIGISEDNELCKTEDSWESSYILDILSESGIDGAHPNTFLDAWHSPECPVSPSVFEELEKRYSDRTSCPRSERRLLFDRINTSLVKVYQQSMNAQPWVSPAATHIGSKLIKNGLQYVMCTLLGSQGKVTDDALGKVLVRESQWLDVRDDIDVIGREVERLLLDDLVAEIAGT